MLRTLTHSLTHLPHQYSTFTRPSSPSFTHYWSLPPSLTHSLMLIVRRKASVSVSVSVSVVVAMMRVFALTAALATAPVGVTSAAVSEWQLPPNDKHLDFSNISSTLQSLFTHSLDHSCGMPQTAVIFTYSNKYHMEMLRMQYESTRVMGGSNEACLAARFVTVCLDKDCHHTCLELGLHHCTLVSTTNIVYPPSNFLQGAFFYLSYIKYLLIQEFFKFATELFFVDADVLVYCNPWQRVSLFNNTDVDFVYSPEYLKRRSHINGGQYFLRKTAKVKEWLQLMIGSRSIICKPRVGRPRPPVIGNPSPRTTSSKVLLLDQDYARIYAEKVGLKIAWASSKELGSHNHLRVKNVSLFPPSACTNHVCGVTGKFAE